MPGTSKLETRTVDIKEDFTNITISSDTEEIYFMKATDGKAKVVFVENAKKTHEAVVSDGTLTITGEDLKDWKNFTLFSNGPTKITVYLPKTQYDALSIQEHTGDIDLAKDFTFKTITIKASTGDIDCYASADKINVSLSTGDILMEEVKAGEMTLSVSTGHITLKSVTCDGALGITVSTGKTTLTDVTCKSFTSDGDTGDIRMTNVLVADTMTIIRTTGDVKFDKCDAGEITVNTTTGDVTGSLRSDKVFIVRSNTGDIDVPETTTGGKCKITTDTGDIEIKVK